MIGSFGLRGFEMKIWVERGLVSVMKGFYSC